MSNTLMHALKDGVDIYILLPDILTPFQITIVTILFCIEQT